MAWTKIPKPTGLRGLRIDDLTDIATINALTSLASTIDGLTKQVSIYTKIKKPQ